DSADDDAAPARRGDRRHHVGRCDPRTDLGVASGAGVRHRDHPHELVRLLDALVLSLPDLPLLPRLCLPDLSPDRRALARLRVDGPRVAGPRRVVALRPARPHIRRHERRVVLADPAQLPDRCAAGGLHAHGRGERPDRADATSGPCAAERILTDLIRFRKFFATIVHNKLSLAGLVMILIFVFMSVGAPILVGPYPSQFDRSTPFQSPTSAHPLGTDWQGFDILKLVMYGGQISLLIGFVSSFVAMVIGTSVGLVAGYYGRVTDQVLSRATDFFLVIPWLP